MKKLYMKLNQKDNVVVALRDIPSGTLILENQYSVLTKEKINKGHKVAITSIEAGENVIKYGFPIGHATNSIEAGQHVHTHNLKTNLEGELTYEYKPNFHEKHYPQENATFNGYIRSNGKVGIRNDLYIVPTVGCVNGIAEQIVQVFKEKNVNLKGVDNITILKHPYGCSQLGDDHEMTRSILMDAVHHPNAGGVLVFGLGCENNIVSQFKKDLGEYDSTRVKFLVAQQVRNEVDAGVSLLEAITENMKQDRRQPVSIKHLNVGLKCGGSDGFSGMTANPLLGVFSDYLISQGGSTILTEVPEMFGAENILMERAENQEVFKKIVSLINEFKEYFLSFGEPIYENPSPGNKEGGISTLEDKSLGCTQKAGTSKVVDVLQYGEKIKKSGLSLLQAPGNDLVASSALAAADCQLVLFTTGRGTPFGTFVPTIKIATNTELYENKKHWMDFNAGRLLDEEMDQVLLDFIQFILDTASGLITKNEKNDTREVAIFKTGVTL